MSQDVLIGAIILAAGKGERIGCPKWQLKWHGKTFLEMILLQLAPLNLTSVYCVLEQGTQIPQLASLQFVMNHQTKDGMLSSIDCAVRLSSEAIQGYFIVPVDHPFVPSETYQVLKNAFLEYPNYVIRPSYNMHRGHPVLAPGYLMRQIVSADYAAGLKQYLNKHRAIYIDVPVQDENVLKNINRWEDLLALK